MTSNTRFDGLEAAQMLSALAHVRSLALFRHVYRCGSAGCTASELVGATQTPASAVSTQLRSMEAAGLVKRFNRGGKVMNAACLERLHLLRNYLFLDDLSP